MDSRPEHPSGQAHADVGVSLLKQVGQVSGANRNPAAGKGRVLPVLTGQSLLTSDQPPMLSSGPVIWLPEPRSPAHASREQLGLWTGAAVVSGAPGHHTTACRPGPSAMTAAVPSGGF